ncbi:MAG TPA: hypothetical protein G4O18_00265 [Dehalococcoidia bacterium]|nr:hypothetical protein [Dehalococcoidia bacterium]
MVANVVSLCYNVPLITSLEAFGSDRKGALHGNSSFNTTRNLHTCQTYRKDDADAMANVLPERAIG